MSSESGHIYFGKCSVDDELMSLSAWGEKLLHSLAVWQWMLLYLFQLAAG